MQYCGSSLSRVGLDFQGLLQPLFETCSLGLLAQHLAGAVEVFNTRGNTCVLEVLQYWEGHAQSIRSGGDQPHS
eukprot:scaffold68904_cov24-Tisochrysis_lutea.AAC.2